MSDNESFFSAVLDSLDAEIAVIDGEGAAVYVNRSWSEFAIENALPVEFARLGSNYLQACDAAAAGGDELAAAAARGIREVVDGKRAEFYLEYPCHSPEQQRWFMMHVGALRDASKKLFVIAHHNITQRKLAEEKVEGLSLHDPLTGLSNRRHFDRFLRDDWQRGMRSRSPISLIMLDIDHFKEYNDRLGHVAGDECLRRISRLLEKFARRPGDLAVRFGGDEFALILSDTGAAESQRTAEKIREAVHSLDLHFAESERISISAGVASTVPGIGQSEAILVDAADHALYSAKQVGRNRVMCAHPAAVR